jgi:predicted secreted protein
MVTTAVDTFGTTLTLDGSPVGQIQDVDGPNLSTDTDEITNHDSPGGVEEFIATIKRTGEVTFPVVFDPGAASHAAVVTAWSAKTLDAWVLTYPDGSTWEFDAYTIGVGMTAPVAGHLAANVTLRPSGEPTWTPAS